MVVEFLVTPSFVGRFVLYETHDHEAAFDERLASADYRSFAAAIEDEIEQFSVRRFALSGGKAENIRLAG